VDIYDALTSTRSYRKSLPEDAALEVLWDETNRGWWDKEIMTAFTKMLRQGQGPTAHEGHSSPSSFTSQHIL